MDNGLHIADYAVIIGFFVIMVGIGLYFQKKVKTMGDFFGGGKQVPWWLAGISFYMCSFSAMGFVVYSALAYQYGFVAITIYWLTVPAMLISAKYFAARWRRVAETSPLEYIEHRYGNAMRQGLVWLGIPARILDDALKLLAIGTVVAAAMGFPLAPAIIVSGLIMISYTFLGGLWAAMVADFIQFIVLLAAVLVLPFLTLNKAGGFSAFVNSVPDGFFNLVSVKYSWSYIVVFFVIVLLNYSTSWALVQRYYSTDSDRNARKVGYFVAILNFLGPPIFYMPAMIGRVFLPEIENTNEVYAIVCKAVLPVGMIGMVIAAMFSATMSMLAGDFNAVASVLTNDLYKRMIRKNASPEKLMLLARINTLLVGVIVIGITFMIREIQGSGDLFQVMVKIFGLFLPPVAIPMLLGMLTKKISNFGGLLGLFAGIGVGFIAFVFGTWYPGLRHEQVLTLITSLTTITGLVLGTLFKPDSMQQKERVCQFIDQASLDGLAERKGQKNRLAIPLFPIIAIATFAIGFILAISVTVTRSFNEGMLSICIGTVMMLIAAGFWFLASRSKKQHVE